MYKKQAGLKKQTQTRPDNKSSGAHEQKRYVPIGRKGTYRLAEKGTYRSAEKVRTYGQKKVRTYGQKKVYLLV